MPKKEPQIPLSDVVQLLSGRKPAKKKKVVRRKKPVQAGTGARQGDVRPTHRMTGQSGFSFQPSLIHPPNQQFIQPPPQVVRPINDAARSQTININTNYDPDRRKEVVESNSKSGVVSIEMNPNDLNPRISSRRLIEGPPSALRVGYQPPAQESFQPQNPAARLNPRVIQEEVIPSAPYDPLRPGGRPPQLVEDIEEYGAYERELQDQAMMEAEEFDGDEQMRRMVKLTRRNPITGQLEQYARGGVLRRAAGGRIPPDHMIKRDYMIPPGPPQGWDVFLPRRLTA